MSKEISIFDIRYPAFVKGGSSTLLKSGSSGNSKANDPD